MDLKQIVFDCIKNIEFLKDVTNLKSLITFTADSKKGDVTLPCFSFAKILRKSPQAIGCDIIDNCQSDFFEKIENIGGYVNFFFDRKVLFSKAINYLENYKPANIGEGKTVFIDFCSVNLAKYMHVGHLSTTVIGSVIANTYEFLGYTLKRINYVGDYGTPFGKMISAIVNWGDVNDIEKGGVDYVQGLYVKFNKESENDPTLIGQARDWSLKIENKDEQAMNIYNKIIEVSIKETRRLCEQLNVTFDMWRGESYYDDKMQPVLDELRDKGLLQESQGAQIVDLEEHGLGVCMIQRSDGGTLYSTRDLATAIDRYNDYHFDLGLYVTSGQQKLHFERFFKVLELMNKPFAKNLKHIFYGTYSLPTGKIGSRFGKQALVKDMLEQSVEKARQVIKERGSKVEDSETLANHIGIGAIKFGVLKTERIKDCVFDMEQSLNFDGETSPYIQYTHARCNSILKRAEQLEMTSNLEDIDNFDSVEIVKHLINFEPMIISSAEDFEPCYISRYLLNLCALFNKFYNAYRIIDDEKVSARRLEIVKYVKNTLNMGLTILGINAPDAM